MTINTVVIAMLVWLVVLPPIASVHELGHALAALCLTGRPVTAQRGRTPPLLEGSRGTVISGLSDCGLPD